jgi:hypothetical protein
MSPEEKARLAIDRKLEDAGWKIVDRKSYSPSISAVAICCLCRPCGIISITNYELRDE